GRRGAGAPAGSGAAPHPREAAGRVSTPPVPPGGTEEIAMPPAEDRPPPGPVPGGPTEGEKVYRPAEVAEICTRFRQGLQDLIRQHPALRLVGDDVGQD